MPSGDGFLLVERVGSVDWAAKEIRNHILDILNKSSKADGLVHVVKSMKMMANMLFQRAGWAIIIYDATTTNMFLDMCSIPEGSSVYSNLSMAKKRQTSLSPEDMVNSCIYEFLLPHCWLYDTRPVSAVVNNNPMQRDVGYLSKVELTGCIVHGTERGFYEEKP